MQSNHRPRTLYTFIASVVVVLALASCHTAADIPASLTALAHHSENLYDAARAESWNAALGQLDTVRRSVADLRKIPNLAAELLAGVDSELVLLGASVPKHDGLGTLRSANQVTRLAAELTRPYRPSVPPEITLLDYAGRELELWAQAGDLIQLHRATATMRGTWNSIRARVESQLGGLQVAADFEKLVARAEAASSAAEYTAVATPILEEVDRLEQLFPNTDAPD